MRATASVSRPAETARSFHRFLRPDARAPLRKGTGQQQRNGQSHGHPPRGALSIIGAIMRGRNILVVGAGPVGTVAALACARSAIASRCSKRSNGSRQPARLDHAAADARDHRELA